MTVVDKCIYEERKEGGEMPISLFCKQFLFVYRLSITKVRYACQFEILVKNPTHWVPTHQFSVRKFDVSQFCLPTVCPTICLIFSLHILNHIKTRLFAA